MQITEKALDVINRMKEGANRMLEPDISDHRLPPRKYQSQYTYKYLKVTLPEAVNVMFPVPVEMIGESSDKSSEFRFNQPTYPGLPPVLKDRLEKELKWRPELNRPCKLDD